MATFDEFVSTMTNGTRTQELVRLLEGVARPSTPTPDCGSQGGYAGPDRWSPSPGGSRPIGFVVGLAEAVELIKGRLDPAVVLGSLHQTTATLEGVTQVAIVQP